MDAARASNPGFCLNHFQVWLFETPVQTESYRELAESSNPIDNSIADTIRATETARNVLHLVTTAAGTSEQERLFEAMEALR